MEVVAADPVVVAAVVAVVLVLLVELVELLPSRAESSEPLLDEADEEPW